MRIAIIDCGTNTFHLLVAEITKGGYHNILVNEKRNVKLGEGRLLQNEISPAAFKRGIDAFGNLKEIAFKNDADIIKAYATSAVRSARNGKEFSSRINDLFGTEIEIIDGKREAELIYKGVLLAMDKIPSVSLIMDIGGGSTEFILCDAEGIIWKQSFDLGVARLIQKFKPHDPVKEEDIRNLEKWFNQVLEPLGQQVKKHSPALLIGCSGSFESLASMINRQLYNIPPDEFIKSYPFKEEDYTIIHNKLLKSDEQQRLSFPGLIEARVDTIVFASIFINYIRRDFNIQEMIFSNYALKEGAFSEIAEGFKK